MSEKAKPVELLDILPLTPERWNDFEDLFGPHGASAGCWCMYWRMGREFSSTKGEPHRVAMKALVDSGVESGLLAYVNGTPAAWVSVAPRSEFIRLQTSKTLFPIDEQPVWSIPCFFIGRRYRGKGLTTRLIEAAVDYARSHGARIVEAYPIDTRETTSAADLFTGIQKLFERCGFVEAERRGDRPILRKTI